MPVDVDSALKVTTSCSVLVSEEVFGYLSEIADELRVPGMNPLTFTQVIDHLVSVYDACCEMKPEGACACG